MFKTATLVEWALFSSIPDALYYLGTQAHHHFFVPLRCIVASITVTAKFNLELVVQENFNSYSVFFMNLGTISTLYPNQLDRVLLTLRHTT